MVSRQVASYKAIGRTSQFAHQQQEDLRLAVRECLLRAGCGRRELGGNTLGLIFPPDTVRCRGLRNSITVMEGVCRSAIYCILQDLQRAWWQALMSEAPHSTGKEALHVHSNVAVKQDSEPSETYLAGLQGCRHLAEVGVQVQGLLLRREPQGPLRLQLCRCDLRKKEATPMWACFTATGSWKRCVSCNNLCGIPLPSTLQLHHELGAIRRLGNSCIPVSETSTMANFWLVPRRPPALRWTPRSSLPRTRLPSSLRRSAAPARAPAPSRRPANLQ